MWLFVSFAFAAPPAPPDPAVLEHDARTLRTRGTVEIASGIVGMGGGVAVLLVGRGPSGDISTEDPVVADVRAFSGAILLLGGFTVTLVGGNDVGRASRLRDVADSLTVQGTFDGNTPGLRLTAHTR